MLQSLSIQKLMFLASGLAVISLILASAVGTYGMLRSNDSLAQQTATTSAVRSGMLADMMHDGIRADVTLAVLLAVDPTTDDLRDVSAGLDDNIATLERALAEISTPPLPTGARGRT